MGVFGKALFACGSEWMSLLLCSYRAHLLNGFQEERKLLTVRGEAHLKFCDHQIQKVCFKEYLKRICVSRPSEIYIFILFYVFRRLLLF